MATYPSGALQARIRELEEALFITGLIFQNLSDGLIYVDHSGKISRINLAMEKMLGKKEEEVHGRPLKEIVGEGELCHLLVAEPGVDGFSLGGRQYDVEIIELKDKKREGLGLVAVFRDVTEKQRLEQERSDFLSMLTHDLKSPLTTIMGYTALMKDGSIGELPPVFQEPVAAIERGGKKLIGSIEDLLTLSRYDTGMKPPVFIPLELSGVAKSAVEAIALDAARARKNLSFRAEPGLPQIMGDQKQLERLVMNLLDNALKFSPTGAAGGSRGEISVELKQASLVPGQEAADAVELKVVDNGIGIPAEEIPFLFDRYWRGSKSRGLRGSGLGLAIVKCVAEMHQGAVSVQSEEGKGSEFSVVIPARK
ncbi:MAG: PAS domain-containing sensor histidine kinase [Nitrospirota bacterium]